MFNIGNECNPFDFCQFTEENALLNTKGIDIFYDTYKQVIDSGVAVNAFLPALLCLQDKINEIIIGPEGALYSCITGLGHEHFKMCDRQMVLSNPLHALSAMLTSKKKRKSSSCYKCPYYGLCNGGCAYEKFNKNLKSSCQHELFDSRIFRIIDILSDLEEISPDTFRKKR